MLARETGLSSEEVHTPKGDRHGLATELLYRVGGLTGDEIGSLSGISAMPKTPKIIPISDLRKNASDVVKDISASKQPVFITQRGRAAAYESTPH